MSTLARPMAWYMIPGWKLIERLSSYACEKNEWARSYFFKICVHFGKIVVILNQSGTDTHLLVDVYGFQQ